ncbi:TetR/AcrR family transcriptional regulator [Microbacterium sp. T2.11-28]|uniref:TetR/AcrR family transcriptional regulator n=1 Tax=Microbacterium sp. T2.11-28 TaxID=3041169 RepID=UPI0024779713|nr:TetR/AcrR family transcriptional regulator [Microbacterium sp. T2.11-28]CAI9390103.1 hypothetical protein MICABA_01338 [Microbacterium sp. T2.11-28]
MREVILSAARRLVLSRGVVPSLNAVAESAGVSKGGLIHHFPSRAALLAALAHEVIGDVDAAMDAAARTNSAAETWLRLSLPGVEERELLRALAAAFRPADPAMQGMLDEARVAIQRWEALIEAEVGDPVRARVIRLVGDALVANAVAGVESAPDLVDELAAFLLVGRPEPDLPA